MTLENLLRCSASQQNVASKELIAAAVYNYNANKDVVGEGLEVFARFVCVAFRGAGLDPMRPGG